MIAQFEVVSDGSKWEIDVENLTWSQVTDDPENTPRGELVFQTANLYNLSGRTPDSPAPGAGLCSVLLIALPVGQVLWIYLRANVETKNFTMPRPIKEIRYEIIPFSK